jgi:hypothetical protein
VGYDLAFDRFDEAQRAEVRGVLVGIGQKYFEGYFSTPTIVGPGFHTHHAVVEWGSFGVAALALRDETPQAQAWLDATRASAMVSRNRMRSSSVVLRRVMARD